MTWRYHKKHELVWQGVDNTKKQRLTGDAANLGCLITDT